RWKRQCWIPRLLKSERRFRSCSADRVTCPSSLEGLHGPARSPHQAKPAAFSVHHCNCYQDFLGWRHPFHGHLIATFRRPKNEQGGLLKCALHDSIFVASTYYSAC